MDIKQLAKKYALEVFNTYEDETESYVFSEGMLELFAKKIIAARDAEWMVEPAAWIDQSGYLHQDNGSRIGNYGQRPLFKKPKEVK